MIDILVPLYLVGGLLATGMLVADLYSAMIGDVAEAVGVGDKLKTVCFQLLQTVIFIALAVAFSWVAVGFLYMDNKRQ
jgi:membrane protein implicated in regulation of membrane protease activity